MARRIDAKILSLVSRVRAPRHRLAVLSLLGLILLAQSALVVHRVEHNAVAHDAACALCVAASHASGPANAVQVYEPSLVLVALQPVTAELAIYPHFDLPYLSRAPPALHDAA